MLTIKLINNSGFLLLNALALSEICFFSSVSKAQIIPDTTLPNQTTVIRACLLSAKEYFRFYILILKTKPLFFI